MRALLERWRSDMLNTTKARHITPDKRGNWTVTDQLALTLIFTVGPSPSPALAPPSRRVHLALQASDGSANGQLALTLNFSYAAHLRQISPHGLQGSAA